MNRGRHKKTIKKIVDNVSLDCEKQFVPITERLLNDPNFTKYIREIRKPLKLRRFLKL